MQFPIVKVLTAIFIITSGLAISACGGGGGGSSSSSSSSSSGGDSSDEVEKSLNALGVDTSKDGRLNDMGTALPSSYSPMGSTKAITKIAELFFVGIDSPSGAPQVQSLAEYQGTSPLATLYVPPDTTWAESLIRAGTAADVDGDGFEEVLLVYRSNVDSLIRLRMVEDTAEGHVEQEWIISDLLATDLAITAGDYDIRYGGRADHRRQPDNGC